MSDDRDESAPIPSIPLTFKAGGKTVSRSQMIQQPTSREVNQFSSPRVKTCGTCRHFDKNEKTDEFIRRNQIFEKMVESGWKNPGRYMPTTRPGALQELGICGQSQGQRMVGPTSGACDQYRLKR